MASKSSPKKTAEEYVCNVGMNYPGPDGPRHRSEAGDPYLGNDPEPLLKRGLISVVPAVAGSSQPGDEEGTTE